MIRRFMPKTLFARALLILVVPTILVQVLTAYIFYERHWSNVTRHMANSLAGEISFLAYQASGMDHRQREALTWIFEQTTGISSTFEPEASLIPHKKGQDEALEEFRTILSERMDLPFMVERFEEEGRLLIRLQFPDGVLALTTTLKRLESGTTYIFILWMIGGAMVFSCIAIIFLRNQVRPIRQLAEASESFGKGRDIPDFKPHGAQEVRRAARAFLVMRERIQRQIRWRTEMLAGISHDLRTPLTRMKLQLEMLKKSPEVEDMQNDVTQMEHMIKEYLDFARGDAEEEATPISIGDTLKNLADNYRRHNHDITLNISEPIGMTLRYNAFVRMMQNLIDNALRYGNNQCVVTTQLRARSMEIVVDDAGAGIPAAEREEVFRPFTRLDAARNLNTGGVGLGLTIARDIARSHGGNITLADSPLGGLRVVVRLPL